MTSPVLYEGWFTGGFLVSEANGRQSRDGGTIANTTTADVVLNAGLVLTASPSVTPGATNADASGTVTGISLGVDVIPGTYTATATSATQFSVVDAAGRALGTATVGAAFVSREISFTIGAGAGTFAAGDSFAIGALGSGAYAAYTSTSGPADAVLFDRAYVPAGGSVEITVISRNAEVNRGELQWDATVTAAGNAATLMAEGIAGLGQRNILAR